MTRTRKRSGDKAALNSSRKSATSQRNVAEQVRDRLAVVRASNGFCENARNIDHLHAAAGLLHVLLLRHRVRHHYGFETACVDLLHCTAAENAVRADGVHFLRTRFEQSARSEKHSVKSLHRAVKPKRFCKMKVAELVNAFRKVSQVSEPNSQSMRTNTSSNGNISVRFTLSFPL